MANYDFLINPMRDAANLLHKNGLGYIFKQDVHFSPLYIEHSKGESIIPLLEFENEVHFEGKILESRRRMKVFSVGNLIFKSGEISTDQNYDKFLDDRGDFEKKESANFNITVENRERLDNQRTTEQPALLIYDRVNGRKSAAEEKSLTLSDLARKYNPLNPSDMDFDLEKAAVRIYTILEEEGKVFVPRIMQNGKVDLGDILIKRDSEGNLEIKLTDNPILLPKAEAKIDNSQSLGLILSSFYNAVANRGKNLLPSNFDVLKNLRRGITYRGLNHRFS